MFPLRNCRFFIKLVPLAAWSKFRLLTSWRGIWKLINFWNPWSFLSVKNHANILSFLIFWGLCQFHLKYVKPARYMQFVGKLQTMRYRCLQTFSFLIFAFLYNERKFFVKWLRNIVHLYVRKIYEYQTPQVKPLTFRRYEKVKRLCLFWHYSIRMLAKYMARIQFHHSGKRVRVRVRVRNKSIQREHNRLFAKDGGRGNSYNSRIVYCLMIVHV